MYEPDDSFDFLFKVVLIGGMFNAESIACEKGLFIFFLFLFILDLNVILMFGL